jgi:hypothetical protein
VEFRREIGTLRREIGVLRRTHSLRSIARGLARPFKNGAAPAKDS